MWKVPHLSDDRFLARVAASLLGGLDSLARHVCAEGSEHMLQGSGLGARTAAVMLLPRALLTDHVSAFSCACNLQQMIRSGDTSLANYASQRYCIQNLCNVQSNNSTDFSWLLIAVGRNLAELTATRVSRTVALRVSDKDFCFGRLR